MGGLLAALTSATSCSTASPDAGGAPDAGPGNTAITGSDGSDGLDAAAGGEAADGGSPASTGSADASVDGAPSPDGGAAGPTGADAAAPLQGDGGDAASGSVAMCRTLWPQTDWLSVYRTMMATDAQGNSYVALNYGDNRPLNDHAGAPQLNLGAPPSRFGAGFAVARLDDACNLVWVREFGSGAADSYGAEAIAIGTDAASDVTILGDFTGSVDFGAGTLTTPSGVANGVLLRLDANGATVFSRQFVSPTSSTGVGTQTEEYDLAVTPGGVSTVALQADSHTDFGSGPDSASLLLGAASNNYLVQFDATGQVLFRKTVPSIDSSVASIFNLATSASGFLWTLGTAASLVSPNVTPPQDLVMGVSASGAFAWRQDLASWPLIAAGPGGAVEGYAGGNSMTLQALAADGTSGWTTSSTIDGDVLGGRLAVGATGEPVLVGSFRGTMSFGSAPPLASAGGQDVGYWTFDTTGHLVSMGAWGTPDDDQAGGVGVDPAGNVLIAGSSTPPGGAATSQVFFVKLPR
jgi:hypothetical protein